jgi:Na+-driven multidrug efflux pump
MWHSALSYLRVRAFGTPAATLWLVTNGIFRGLGDTKTPLIYSLAFTLMNAIFDPIFIFTFKYGAAGAALGTALAQYIALIPLLYSLHKRVGIDIVGNIKKLSQSLYKYLEAGGYVFFRTIGKVLAYSVCAREAVRVCVFDLNSIIGFDSNVD